MQSRANVYNNLSGTRYALYMVMLKFNPGDKVLVKGSKLYPDGYIGTVERSLMMPDAFNPATCGARYIVIPDFNRNRRHYVSPEFVTRIHA